MGAGDSDAAAQGHGQPPDQDLHQPHDKLFGATFAVPENTAALLRAELPAALAEAIDWDSLKHEPGSFIDSRFRSSLADLLFSAQFRGRETFLYFLFEHQSTRDPRLPLRLLTYMARIWERLDKLRPSPQKLPPILPVVLSQNAESWDVSESLAALLDIPADLEAQLRPFVPDFIYHHLQLAELDYDSIPGTSTGIFVLRAMKAKRRGEFLTPPVWDEELILQVPPEIFEMVLRYILDSDIDRAAFETKLRQIQDPELRRSAMTLAQVYRQEGRQEGRQESILETLELRFGSIPDGLVELVCSVGDDAALRHLHRAAIQCGSLEEFSLFLQ